MGIANPRPQMRRGERRRIEQNLERHRDLMLAFQHVGDDRETASRKALEALREEDLAEDRARRRR